MPLVVIFYVLLPQKVMTICLVTHQNNKRLTQILESIVNLMEAQTRADASYLALYSLMYVALGKLARLRQRFNKFKKMEQQKQ